MYCKDYNNQPSSARLRAPSVNKFARTFTNKCDGKLKIHFFADGTVKCFVYGCTNTKHSSINKLEDVEKSYIIEKLKLRMNFTQIRSAFINRFSKNISRYQVNNIKYRNQISFEFFTNKNDLVSTRNIIDTLQKCHNIHSNLHSIQKLEDIILVMQFNHQKKMLDYNTGVFCIDSTHGITK